MTHLVFIFHSEQCAAINRLKLAPASMADLQIAAHQSFHVQI